LFLSPNTVLSVANPEPLKAPNFDKSLGIVGGVLTGDDLELKRLAPVQYRVIRHTYLELLLCFAFSPRPAPSPIIKMTRATTMAMIVGQNGKQPHNRLRCFVLWYSARSVPVYAPSCFVFVSVVGASYFPTTSHPGPGGVGTNSLEVSAAHSDQRGCGTGDEYDSA
jgi:hypothetical protein